MSTHDQNFLTATPDLSRSLFNVKDLKEARRVYRLVFEKHAPRWEVESVGVMAQLWNQETRPAVERLIDIARVLYDFSRGITKQSVPAFDHKVNQLLNCKGEKQFEELLAELRVGAWLAVKAGPVACEPLSRPLDYKNSTQSTSPDFGVRLPESDILIEVTTMRINVIDRWERELSVIRKRVTEANVKAGLAKAVEIHAPFGVCSNALTRSRLNCLVSEMKTVLEGAMEVQLGSAAAKVVWRELDVIHPSSSELGLDSILAKPFSKDDHSIAKVVASEGTITACSASKIVPIFDADVENLFLKSIRNTIDGKRSQCSMQIPSLLIFQLGNWQKIRPDYVIHLIAKRIWPNCQYSWLTGIGVLQQRRTYNSSEPPNQLSVSWNPNPKNPRTASLNELIENEAKFSDGVKVENA